MTMFKYLQTAGTIGKEVVCCVARATFGLVMMTLSGVETVGMYVCVVVRRAVVLSVWVLGEYLHTLHTYMSLSVSGDNPPNNIQHCYNLPFLSLFFTIKHTYIYIVCNLCMYPLPTYSIETLGPTPNNRLT